VIDAALIETLADAVERQGLDEAAIAALRGAHPGMHFSVCDDDDVPARLVPAAARAGFNVYLVDAGEHCVKFTSDLQQSSGMVFARVDEG
jgi:Family of unknown function (DUF6129)